MPCINISPSVQQVFSPTAPNLAFDPARSPRQSPDCVTAMTTNEQPSGRSLQPPESVTVHQAGTKVSSWRRIFRGTKSAQEPSTSGSSIDGEHGNKAKPEKWSMGVLNDRETDEVPGTFGAQCYRGLLRVTCCSTTSGDSPWTVVYIRSWQ